jgi:hypothetical protein
LHNPFFYHQFIVRLPPAGRRNKADQSKRGSWTIQKGTVRSIVPIRWRERLDPEVAYDLLEQTFGNIPVE